MQSNFFNRMVFIAGPLVLLTASGCKPRNYNSTETMGRAEIAAKAELLKKAAATCFTPIDEAQCVETEPAQLPDQSFICLGAYLKLSPQIDFIDATGSINRIDAYREADTGLNLVLRKHFTFKYCEGTKLAGQRQSYSAAALQAGYKVTSDDSAVQSLMASGSMSRKAKANKGKVDTAIADPAQAAKAEFAINNLLCIRNLADIPCYNAYPKYVPLTKINSLIGMENIKNVIGSIAIANEKITWLPALDPAQKADLAKLGINNENYQDRVNLVAKAANSILISSWQIKNKDGDIAGKKIADAIRSSGAADKRIIGDLSTSYGNPYFVQPDRSYTSEVMAPYAIIWGNGVNKSYTYHRKLTIIDGNTVIFGGKNYASEYMQQYNGPKDWRDTDVKIVDAGAAQLAKTMFEDDWKANTQEKYSQPSRGETSCTPTTGKTCFKFITHDPARQSGSSNTSDYIYASIIQAIQGAKKTVDIENAYVIATPALLSAIRQKAQAGIRIRVFTNSSQSIDVPELAQVMNLSAQAIAHALKDYPQSGVYLKTATGTSTLHSKFMIVDGQKAIIGTYNLHPASRTTASEFVGVFEQASGDSNGPVTQLSQIFESDVKTIGQKLQIIAPGMSSSLNTTWNNTTANEKAAAVGILAMGYDIL